MIPLLDDAVVKFYAVPDSYKLSDTFYVEEANLQDISEKFTKSTNDAGDVVWTSSEPIKKRMVMMVKNKIEDINKFLDKPEVLQNTILGTGIQATLWDIEGKYIEVSSAIMQQQVPAAGAITNPGTPTNKCTLGKKIKITKTDAETAEKLADVKFNILQAGNVVETVTTDSEGVAVTSILPLGTYQVQEKEAKAGYILDTKTTELDLKTAEEKIVSIALENTKDKRKIKILKTDADTNTPLEGVEFKLLQGDQELETLVTDKNGEVESKEYLVGKYSLKETKPLEGY